MKICDRFNGLDFAADTLPCEKPVPLKFIEAHNLTFDRLERFPEKPLKRFPLLRLAGTYHRAEATV